MYRQTDRHTDTTCLAACDDMKFITTNLTHIHTDIHTNKQTDRCTERHTDKQTDRHNPARDSLGRHIL